MTSFNKLTIDGLDFRDKRVLLRVDFNVPFNDKNEIADDTRIRAALSTIQKVLNDGGKVILMSHLGRPKGKVVENLRLRPVADRLSELLEQKVIMAPDCIGPEVEDLSNTLLPGECMLLENLRFHPGETANDPDFAEKLSRSGDIYINDAFGTAHRTHASIVGVTRFFDKCAAGFLMSKEIKYLAKILEKPKSPYLAIIGGAKIAGKIDVMQNILKKVDVLLVGGGMMFTFLKATGLEIGDSLLDENKVDLAREILEAGKERIKLPVDCVVADSFSPEANIKTVSVENIQPGWRGMDIGPETLRSFYSDIIKAQTIFWNGPMGVVEMEPFANGTRELASYIADSTSEGAVSVIGGGDSAAAIAPMGLEGKMTHISTGGGATLEMLEGKELPGLSALTGN